MTDTPQLLLAHHLKTLRLPTFLREYDKLARQCAAEGSTMWGVTLRHRKSQRCRAIRLSQRRAQTHDARPSDEPYRRSLALKMESLKRRKLADMREMGACEPQGEWIGKTSY